MALRIGKVKESVYNRSVKKQLHKANTNAPYLVKTVHVDGWTLAAERVIYNMIHTFAADKGQLSMITVSVMMPEATEEPELRSFMACLGQLCLTESIVIQVDEVKVLPQITKTQINAVGIGTATDKDSKIEPWLDIVVIGTIACEGAAILARDHEEELKKRFAGFYVDIAKDLFDACKMNINRMILEQAIDAEAIWATAVGEGGIFAALWELAAAGKVGLDIDLSAIPIRQHAIEICEYFNLNPYMLLSGGCILLITRHGEELIAPFARMGITAAVIGHTTSDNDKIIRYDDEIRYLEPPKTDEIYHHI